MKDHKVEKAKRLGHEVVDVNNGKYDAENYRLIVRTVITLAISAMLSKLT